MGCNRIIASLLRADGSQHLGLGHIMRCLAFAQSLEKLGVRSIFVIRDYEQKVTEIIQHYNYSVELIPESCGFKEDLLLTSEFASQYRVKLIVTDLCNVDILANLGKYCGYLQGLKDKGKFLITIDDLNEMAFPSDIVVNTNYGAQDRNYRFGGSTKFLLGPAYFIFRQEFIEAAKVNRTTRGIAQNILVTMGGSDLLALTLKVAKAFTRLDSSLNLNLRIVLGIDYTDSKKRALAEALKDYRGNYKLIMGSDNLAELMLWSDLAITGGGLTKYETAVTGTPSIIISQVGHQAALAKEFEREWTTLNLGLGSKVDEADISEAVEKLLMDDTLRAEMSRRGKRLVDGRGIERIISEIPQEVFS